MKQLNMGKQQGALAKEQGVLGKQQTDIANKQADLQIPAERRGEVVRR